MTGVAGVALVPAPVEVLGDGAELDDQVVGKVFGLDLPAFLAPQPNQTGLVIAHDDPGIRAADETARLIRLDISQTSSTRGVKRRLSHVRRGRTIAASNSDGAWASNGS